LRYLRFSFATAEPGYSRLAIEVGNAAHASLSDEDKFLVTDGRERRDPFKSAS
jgi:hypothetical protein